MLNGLRYCVLENRSDWQLASGNWQTVAGIQEAGLNLGLATSQPQVTNSQLQKEGQKEFRQLRSLLELKDSGGYSDGVPPLPIPNREVKPVSADGTA